MIRATPNCVKWEQVNRVNYRFQTLNFPSDILESLVLNSPPLTRRDRANSASSAPSEHNEQLSRVKKRLEHCRSLSFDGVKRTSKCTKESSLSNHTVSIKYAPVRKVGIAHQIVMPESVKDSTEDSKVSSGSGELQMKIDHSQCEVSGTVNDRFHSNRTKGVGMLYVTDCTKCEQPQTDLGSKTKEELMELVHGLKNELKEARRSSSSMEVYKFETSTMGNTGLNPSSSHCSSTPKPELRNPSHSSGQDQQCIVNTDSSLLVQMHLLETEIQRAQNITAQFEKELHTLKTRLSRILSKSQSIHDDYNLLADCEDVDTSGDRLDSVQLDNSTGNGISQPIITNPSKSSSNSPLIRSDSAPQ